ncbi:MAG: hypothetical protein KDD48_08155 [Bdellovibrionales bacterium]|nr:hypothetical protein [Bdellovibrionales bacterium]
MLVEEIKSENALLAIIVSHKFREHGVHFFSPDNLSQQIAYMRHPSGKVIQPHIHKPVERSVQYTQETLLIKKGKLRVDFYDDKKKYLKSRILSEGDVILLICGGHGFEALDELEMIEVKQGPYAGDQDKERFDQHISQDKIRYI